MAIFQVQTVNGQKQLTPMTGGVPDGSVGSLIMKYKKIQPKNCLYCDGRDTTGTDEELRIYYPALYMYLGSNVLPDYRECTMVGAEQNTTDTIATHDVYAQGEFKDDQMQDHIHTINRQSSSGTSQYNSVVFAITKAWTNGESNGVNSARKGTTTHGKQKAVYVYIVAVDSVVVSDDESFLRVVENYVDEKVTIDYTKTINVGIANSWTATKKCYVEWLYLGSARVTLKINNVSVELSDYSNGLYVNKFSGTLEQGDILSSSANWNSGSSIRVYEYSTS